MNFSQNIYKNTFEAVTAEPLIENINFSRSLWPNWLDRGAIINVGAPGANIGSRPYGAQVGRFSSWGRVVPEGLLAENAYFSSYICKSLNRILIKGAILVKE